MTAVEPLPAVPLTIESESIALLFNYHIARGAMFDEHHLSLYIAVLQVFDVKAEFRKHAVVDDFAAAGRESE